MAAAGLRDQRCVYRGPKTIGARYIKYESAESQVAADVQIVA